VIDAVSRLGLRAAVGPALMDLREPGTDMVAQSTEEALATVNGLLSLPTLAPGGLVQLAISPRGTYNASPELWRECVRIAEANDLRLHTHASENREQADRLEEAFGCRDGAALDAYGALGKRLTIAHGVWFDATEVSLIRDRGAHICHCPSANLKLGSGIAPVPDYLAAGINVAIGTDGAACNNTLDGLAEIRLAALLHKPRYGPAAMPASRVFAMATVGGAAALGLADQVGQLAVGWKADIACVRVGGLSTSPLRINHATPGDVLDAEALASALVYSARADDVDTVLVDGKVVVRGGRLMSADTDHIVRAAAEQRRKLEARMSAA
jgi:cytosine/adenosine deaminase-related metal-dependent hydrolase